MNDVKEQRICIKLCFTLSKTAVETYKMIKEPLGDNVLCLIHEWFKRFKKGWMLVDNDERSGQLSTGPMTENVAKV
jgi:hypothetical protein